MIEGTTDIGIHVQVQVILSRKAEISENAPYDKFLVIVESVHCDGATILWCEADPAGIKFKPFGDPVM